jgi:hypothetical protein
MLKDVVTYRDLTILYKAPAYVEERYQADPERLDPAKIQLEPKIKTG